VGDWAALDLCSIASIFPVLSAHKTPTPNVFPILAAIFMPSDELPTGSDPTRKSFPFSPWVGGVFESLSGEALVRFTRQVCLFSQEEARPGVAFPACPRNF
jgi:hypothetical protein